MPSHLPLRKKPPCGPDLHMEQFDDAFYLPYRAAVESAFATLCRVRRLLYEDMGEETVRQMTFRLKTPESIAGKLRKKHLPVTCYSAGAALHDIAGLRVVLTSEEAVYRYASLLCASPQAQYLMSRDYIAEPKESGYRSLHLLMNIPVICRGQHMLVPLEIQLRTCQMDAWAVADHHLCYKPLAGRISGRAL